MCWRTLRASHRHRSSSTLGIEEAYVAPPSRLEVGVRSVDPSDLAALDARSASMLAKSPRSWRSVDNPRCRRCSVEAHARGSARGLRLPEKGQGTRPIRANPCAKSVEMGTCGPTPPERQPFRVRMRRRSRVLLGRNCKSGRRSFGARTEHEAFSELSGIESRNLFD